MAKFISLIKRIFKKDSTMKYENVGRLNYISAKKKYREIIEREKAKLN